jgi:hypothetical protein
MGNFSIQTLAVDALKKGGKITDDELKVAYLWDQLQYKKEDPASNKKSVDALFKAIDGIKTKADLEKLVAKLERYVLECKRLL